MKTFLVSIKEVINEENFIDEVAHYVVPSKTKKEALSSVLNLGKQLLDGHGYPKIEEITSPTFVRR